MIHIRLQLATFYAFVSGACIEHMRSIIRANRLRLIGSAELTESDRKRLLTSWTDE